MRRKSELQLGLVEDDPAGHSLKLTQPDLAKRQLQHSAARVRQRDDVHEVRQRGDLHMSIANIL